MAEGTKRSKAKSRAKPRAKAKAEPKAKEKSQGTATRLAAKAAEKAGEAPLGPGVNAALAGKAALAGTRAAGRAVGVAASKARAPVVVGGGLVAGAAGGLMLVRRRNGHSQQGSLDVDRLIAAARRAGSFGEELGRMASLMEQASAGSKRNRK